MAKGQQIGEIKPKNAEIDDEQDDKQDDEEHLFIDCPNCGVIGFHFAGVYQADDGQYDNVWYCVFCDYTETT